jgi:hypothetical protein
MVVHVLGIKYNYNGFVEQCNCEICPIQVISLVGEDEFAQVGHIECSFSLHFLYRRLNYLFLKIRLLYQGSTGWGMPTRSNL